MAKERSTKSIYEWGIQAVTDLEQAAKTKTQVVLVNESAFNEAEQNLLRGKRRRAELFGAEILKIATKIKAICEGINAPENNPENLDSIQKGIEEVKVMIRRSLIESGLELHKDQAPRIETIEKP